MKNAFKKGMLLGGILAAVAAAGFARSKAGKEFGEDVQSDLKALAKRLKKDLQKMEDVTKDHFDQLAAIAVEEYGKTKEMAAETKDNLVEALKDQWAELEDAYLADEEKK